MPARPIAGANLSFGLVSVPIQLYSAAESGATISFNWLHKKCGTRLKQQYVCPKDNEKVERDEMEKGYEFAKGQYARFSKDEIKALGMDEKSQGYVNIKQFVPLDKVERLYLDRAYFLGPDKGGDRAYRLLAAALRKTKLAAVGQYAARGKQYLVLVRPIDNGLVMEQLHYADELRSMKEVPLEEGEVNDAELQLAIQLVEQAKADAFHPEQYEDEVRNRIRAQIDRKVQEGEEITALPTEEPQTQIIDLMEALRASVAKGGGEKAASGKKAKAKPASKRKAG